MDKISGFDPEDEGSSPSGDTKGKLSSVIGDAASLEN